jgi:hypothetical protein
MDREIEHIVDTIWQNKGIRDNSSDIKRLDKTVDLVIETIVNLTAAIERLEKSKVSYWGSS